MYDVAKQAHNGQAHPRHRIQKGQHLTRRKTKATEEKAVYRADVAICNACPVKAACTASDHGRMVHRSFDEDYLDRVRGYHASEADQKVMRKRHGQ